MFACSSEMCASLEGQVPMKLGTHYSDSDHPDERTLEPKYFVATQGVMFPHVQVLLSRGGLSYGSEIPL